MMSTFVFDCPCCSAKNSTFDVNGFEKKPLAPYFITWDLFSTCRSCKKSCCISATLRDPIIRSLLSSYDDRLEPKLKSIGSVLTSSFSIEEQFNNFRYIPILPSVELPPEYLPNEIEMFFNEAAKCFSIGCFNAAGAMFRLCLDTTTKYIIGQNTHLNPSTNDNKTIHNRLTWIFNNNILPKSLEDLSRCIKNDGNDAAHDGSLSKEDAADLLDFTYILLERVYTEPARIQNARQRRVERREG